MWSYWERYRRGGLEALREDNDTGGLSYLDEVELQALEVHLQAHLYLTVQRVVAYLEKRLGVDLKPINRGDGAIVLRRYPVG